MTGRPSKPDLDVTYISQRPLYHGYCMDYPNDVPTFWVPDKNVPDGKRTVTKEEFHRLIKHQPAEGDEVTFTAHVRNNGFAAAPATDYKLYIDDKVVAAGQLKALAPDEEAAIPFRATRVSKWPLGRSLRVAARSSAASLTSTSSACT
jgi:hypothetical protein